LAREARAAARWRAIVRQGDWHLDQHRGWDLLSGDDYDSSGTGRLEGTTGTISFEAFQYGYIDPLFVLTPNTVPMDITYSGAYTLR